MQTIPAPDASGNARSIRLIKILAIVAPVVIFGVLCLVRTKTYKPSSPQETLNDWANQKYVPIELTDGFKNQILEIPIESEEPLTSVQKEAIHQAAYDMTVAFYSGTYENYRKFRAPVEPKEYDPTAIEVFRKYCKSNWKNPDHSVPDDPEGVFKRMFEVVFLNKYIVNPVNSPGIGKPFWDAIALKNCAITVTNYKVMPPPLNTIIAHTVGSSVYGSTFVFTNTPEDILQQSGKLRCAVIKLLIEYAKPEPRAPIYCRYYWDESCGQWLPMSLCTPFNISGTRDYVF